MVVDKFRGGRYSRGWRARSRRNGLDRRLEASSILIGFEYYLEVEGRTIDHHHHYHHEPVKLDSHTRKTTCYANDPETGDNRIAINPGPGLLVGRFKNIASMLVAFKRWISGLFDRSSFFFFFLLFKTLIRICNFDRKPPLLHGRFNDR